MKKLIFVRHGKAEDLNPEITDFERSLTTKGKIITRQMAQQFRKNEASVGILITSPAFRAIETAFIFADEHGIKYDKILINSDIYSKMNLESLISMISGTNEKIDTITLFGHNPSFTDIADSLCKGGCYPLPKSGIAGIRFDVSSWKAIRRNSGKLEYFLKPEKKQ